MKGEEEDGKEAEEEEEREGEEKEEGEDEEEEGADMRAGMEVGVWSRKGEEEEGWR